jgi:hypothetical protein
LRQAMGNKGAATGSGGDHQGQGDEKGELSSNHGYHTPANCGLADEARP